MFWNNQTFLDRYFETLYEFFNFQKAIQPVSVNFLKPWWSLLFLRKFAFTLEFTSEILQAVLNSTAPLILGYAISNRSWYVLLIFALSYILMEIINRFVLRFMNIATQDIASGVMIAAHRYFLTVDPIHHATKSSGQIIAKIDRSTLSIHSTIYLFFGNLLPVIAGFASVVVAIALFNPLLGLVGVTSLILISLNNGFFSYINSRSFQKRIIQSSDETASVTTENLVQNALIRSSFGTTEQYNRTQKLIQKESTIWASAAMANGIATSITRILYMLGVLVLAILVFDLVNKNEIDTVTGTTLIITYLNGSSQTLRLGETIRQFTENWQNINDLFDFIRNFGNQTYPVLNSDLETTSLLRSN
ncbi:MAG: hypothetical protein OHK0017_07450 [Patescibacteria group bacterium]